MAHFDFSYLSNTMDISSQMLIDENNAKNLAFSNQEGTITVTQTTTTTVEQTAEGQLLDFGDSLPHINNNANILNNNNNTTTTTGAASQLVTGGEDQ